MPPSLTALPGTRQSEADVTPQRPPSASDRSLRAAHAALPALLYLGVREISVLVLAVLGTRDDAPLLTALTRWDGQWYLGIATGGYAHVPDELLDAYGRQSAETPLAFFPGYPFAVRWLIDATGLSPTAAALLLNIGCGVLGAYGLTRLGRIVRGGSRRTGYVLVGLFAAAPMGVVLSMAYAEALFCALTVWALVGVMERRWLIAGTMALLAGLVRPTALVIILVVAVAALAYAARAGHPKHARIRAAVAALAAPAGLFGYLHWAGDWVRPQGTMIERLASWSSLQRDGWGSYFDGGLATGRFVWDAALGGGTAFEVGTIVVVLGALGLAVHAAASRIEAPLLWYAIGILVMTVGSNGMMTSKARLLLPAFTLLIPAAVWLARRGSRTAALAVAALAVAGSAFGAIAVLGVDAI